MRCYKWAIVVIVVVVECMCYMLWELSDSFYGGLARALANLSAVLHVNNSVVAHRCFFLALRLTIVSLDLAVAAITS